MYVVQLIALEPAHPRSRLGHEPLRHNNNVRESVWPLVLFCSLFPFLRQNKPKSDSRQDDDQRGGCHARTLILAASASLQERSGLLAP